MTEELELRLSKWREWEKAQKGGADSWAKIYVSLFGTAAKDVPSPCESATRSTTKYHLRCANI
jgi:hypothetical protein